MIPFLSYAFTVLGASVYWQEPTIFGHGSEIGLWGTSTR